MHARHDGSKEAWEELHWDQDIARWVGSRRDEFPSTRMRPGHDEGAPRLPGLLD
jgi:hypothetical protein